MARGINLRRLGSNLAISCDETTTPEIVESVWAAFGSQASPAATGNSRSFAAVSTDVATAIPGALRRTRPFMTYPVFVEHRSETEMLRYLRRFLPPVAHTVILALLSAWPAGAFIGSVEMAMGLVRDKRAVASDGDAQSDTDGDSDSDTQTTANAGQGGGAGDKDRDARPGPRRRRRTQPDPVTAAIKKGWDDDKIVARLGVTKRTIQRRRKDLGNAGSAAPG